MKITQTIKYKKAKIRCEHETSVFLTEDAPIVITLDNESRYEIRVVDGKLFTKKVLL